MRHTLYTRARTYYQRHTRPNLGALLADQEPTASTPTRRLPLPEGYLDAVPPIQLAPLRDALRDAFASLKAPTLPLPLQDTRRQQLAELDGELHDLDQREHVQNHYLIVSLAALGLSGAAALTYAPLALASVPLLAYLYIPVAQNVYRAFQEKKLRRLRSFEAILIGGELLAGLYFASALSATLYFIAERALVKAEARSRSSLINVFGQQPRSVWVLIDGVECDVPFEEVKAGDVVVVGAGETISVDGSIVRGNASIDQHMLTGESQPIEKGTGDMVLASTTVLSGKLHIQVERSGDETTAAQIGDILNQTAAFRDTLELRGIALVERFIPYTLMLGAVSLPFVGINRALALLESSFGYDLRMSGPMSVLNLLQIAARQGILIKDGVALEQIHTIDTIVFDKTGTLTLEQPHVGAIYTYNSVSEDTVLTWAAAAEQRQTHPIARAIMQAARERGLTPPAIDDAQYKIDYGLHVVLDGRAIRVGSARYMALEQIESPDALHQLHATCHDQGYSLVLVAADHMVVGAIELHPTLRPEAHEVVQRLKQRELTLYIISGDHEHPTRQMADRLGIDHFFAEVLPQDKAALVEQLQQEGRTVCFVGDGINDAIALKKANLSISLRGASTAATDTAQIVMMDGSLRHLIDLFDLGREYTSTMRVNVLMATVPSIICIGGVYFFHWGVVTAIMIYNLGLVGSLGNAMLPLIVRQWKQQLHDTDPPAHHLLDQPEKGS